MLHKIGPGTSDCNVHVQKSAILLLDCHVLSHDHVIVTCIFAYIIIIKNTEQNEDRIVFRLFILNKINNSAHTPNIDGCLNSS